MDRNHPSNWRQLLAFGSAAAVMVAMASVAYRGTVVSTESNRWARHVVQVLGNLQDLVLDLSETGSAYQDYIVSGSPSYLESYRASLVKVTTDEAALREATADNPGQAATFTVLATRISEQIGFDETVINLRLATGLDAAATAIRGDTNPRTIVAIEAAVTKMRDEESRLFVIRNEDATRRSHEASAGLIIGTVPGSTDHRRGRLAGPSRQLPAPPRGRSAPRKRNAMAHAGSRGSGLRDLHVGP